MRLGFRGGSGGGVRRGECVVTMIEDIVMDVLYDSLNDLVRSFWCFMLFCRRWFACVDGGALRSLR